jgi:hypothetical protein
MSHYLLGGADLDAPLAWRQGVPISRGRYVADVAALRALLPPQGALLNLAADRYQFAVGLGAALLQGHGSLLPPNHTPDLLQRLLRQYPDAYGLASENAAPLKVGLPLLTYPRAETTGAWQGDVPCAPAHALVAEVLTSGSTGTPVAHAKHWGLLVRSAQVGAQRLAQHMGRAHLQGVTLVATVPPQHMYGLESTVLVALLGGAAFDTERPFYAADIARTLARVPRPRMLVTTPFHLKVLLESNITLPPIDLTVCATAPLTPQLAARAEAALAAPLMEIYGCTETGQVATRRTTQGPDWHTYEGLQLSGDSHNTLVQGGHVPTPTVLADVLEVTSPERFQLLGRSNDLINMAGKRSSLSHLNYHLNTVPGVQDGTFWQPPSEPENGGSGIARLVAFVVAPGLPALQLHEHVVASLRESIDPVFLPRRTVAVPALPREPTGKLSAAALDQWALQALALGAYIPAPISAPTTAPTTAPNPTPTLMEHCIELHVHADHPAFAGHFPGNPILPGVVLLAEVFEAVLAVPALAPVLGTAPRLGVVKFLTPVRPGDTLVLRLRHTPQAAAPSGLRFEAWCGPTLAASGHFENGTSS